MADESANKSKPSGFITLPILRDVIFILLITIIGWKLINSELQIDLSKFSFSELLALILSLFSVALSVAFYFKASDTSNQFYDNSYKFTKDMSEILGRIEAGFGERLRHLDEGYSGIRDKFDRLPQYGETKSEEIEKEEKEVKKREKEKLVLQEDLAKRAKLAESEKQEIFGKLDETSQELERARTELRHLIRSNEELASEEREQRQILLRYLADKISGGAPKDTDPTSPRASVRYIFRNIRDKLSVHAMRDLKRFNCLDENGDLTRDTMNQIRSLMGRN